MADDFDNSDEIRNLSDDELATYVRSELSQQKAFDVNDLEISVHNGAVTVAGRVGTEGEKRIVEHMLTDVIALREVNNEIVVDEIRRAVSPEAIDEHLADEEEHSELLLGDVPRSLRPEVERLADTRSFESFGTHDLQDAVETAEPWIPPTGPTPEGVDAEP